LRLGKGDVFKKRVYVTAIEEEADGVVVRFRAPAIGTTTRRQFRPWPYIKAASLTCARLLGGGSYLMVPPPKSSEPPS